MIDLHCHLLPGIDDGAPDLATSLAMARIAVSDGITVTACTPHIYPGLYENTGAGIASAVAELQAALGAEGIDLRLVTGADAHLTIDLLAKVRSGAVPTLAGSRYLLLEPPHHVAPPGFEAAVFAVVAAGYVPVITHPERLTWIEEHHEVFSRLVKGGAWLQVTAGSLTGRFGADARYWGERLLDEGVVHLLATDAHRPTRRAPLLAEGRLAAEKWVGAQEAARLVLDRPRAILEDSPATLVAPPPGGSNRSSKKGGRWLSLRSWFGGRQ